MIITSADLCILKRLFISNEPISMYLFHQDFGLSPVHLSSFVNKFGNDDLLSINNDKIALTSKGKQWIIQNRKKLFLTNRTCEWKNIPQDWILEI